MGIRQAGWGLAGTVLAAGLAGLSAGEGGTMAGGEREGCLPAKEVKVGAVVLRHTAAEPETITGFYLRLANAVGPEKEPVVAGLITGSGLQPETAVIPAFPFPLRDYTKTGGWRGRHSISGRNTVSRSPGRSHFGKVKSSPWKFSLPVQ